MYSPRTKGASHKVNTILEATGREMIISHSFYGPDIGPRRMIHHFSIHWSLSNFPIKFSPGSTPCYFKMRLCPHHAYLVFSRTARPFSYGGYFFVSESKSKRICG